MDLVFGSYRENGLISSEEDSEDSNAENDWRNEYPDSEPSSIEELDMIEAVKNFNIDDLSSDEGEDNIYDEPADLYHEDVKRYGEAYAKYKAKVLSEQPDLAGQSFACKKNPESVFVKNKLGEIKASRNFVHCTEADGYKDDSDDGFYYGQHEDAEHFQQQYADESDDRSDDEPD